MSQTLTPAQLQTLLTSLPPGTKIEIVKTQGGIIVADNNGKSKTKDQLIDEKYAHLRGVGITISQAAEKYSVPRGAIQGWVYSSHDVHFVDEDCYPKLIDEAEIALCADIYKDRQARGITGIPFFDDQGHLVKEVKHPERSERRRKRMAEAK